MIPWWGSGDDQEVMGLADKSTLNMIYVLVSSANRRLLMASEQIETLRTQVAATKGVMESAVTLITGFHDRLVAAGTDPVALDEIKADLATETDKLAAAVAANP